MTRTRVLAALVMAPAAIAAIMLLSTPWLAALAALVLLMGLWEWLKLAGVEDTLPRIVPLVVLGAGVAFFVDSFSVARYVRGYFGEDYFADAYVDPARITFERGRKPPKSQKCVLLCVSARQRCGRRRSTGHQWKGNCCPTR